MDETAHISAREMAELLKVSRTSALRVANNPASKIRSHQEGRLRFYNRSDVEAFAAARQEGRQGLTIEDETVQSGDAPMSSAEDFEEKVDAVELLGLPTVLGSPKSLEDEAVLGNPESLSGDMGDGEPADAPQAELDDASTLSDALLQEAFAGTSPDVAANGSEPALDQDILTSLDLMEQDDNAATSELELDDALDGADDMDLAEAAMLDDAPSGVPESDLVALIREQQQQLITAQHRIGELETLLSIRLDVDEERALRDEIASYKALLDANGKPKKAKKDKKDKKDKSEKKSKADKSDE